MTTIIDMITGENDVLLFLSTLILIIILFFYRQIIRPVIELFLKLKHRVTRNRDPRRTFTTRERRTASKRCDNRCEGTRFFFIRCWNTNELQGDHHWPHSRGGATSSTITNNVRKPYDKLNKKKNNLVMLCPRCNRVKTNHLPTPWETFLINQRRKNY